MKEPQFEFKKNPEVIAATIEGPEGLVAHQDDPAWRERIRITEEWFEKLAAISDGKMPMEMLHDEYVRRGISANPNILVSFDDYYKWRQEYAKQRSGGDEGRHQAIMNRPGGISVGNVTTDNPQFALAAGKDIDAFMADFKRGSADGKVCGIRQPEEAVVSHSGGVVYALGESKYEDGQTYGREVRLSVHDGGLT